jgi:hypothetical protein
VGFDQHESEMIMYSDEELRALSADQRNDLARRLALLEGSPIDQTNRRIRFTKLMLVATLLLIPWTILLGFTLPRNYEAVRWGAVWVGFDVVLAAWLAVTAWAAWRRRQIVIVAALVTATLLLTDVWFDVLTASPRNDLLVSIATAVFGNIPLATLLLVVAYRLIMTTAHNARRMAGDDKVDLPLHKLPLFAVDSISDAS